PENPHHCKVYAARPLICRLFGACASLSKDGVAEFRHCKYNAVKTMPGHLVFFESVPVMSTYGIQLRALDGGEGVVEDLSEAVTEALSIVRLLWSLVGHTMDDDDSTPSPMAS
ncbi:MAG: YkgJ family cysteine cluster protein, partial [Sphaerochaetaceae bacterium]